MPNHRYIIADHIRAACFIIADGVYPSGKNRGYILRRLIRRSFASAIALGIDISNTKYFEELVEAVIQSYSGVYDEIADSKSKIIELINLESTKYRKAIEIGGKEWSKIL